MLQRGFTLIELTVSLTLTAALMVAILGLLGVVSRRSQQINRSAPDDAWRDIMASRLRWDLDNARSWELTAHELILTGFGSLDPTRQRASMAACVVTYQIRAADGKSWLVRTATETQRIDNAPPQVDLVCNGAQRFQVLTPQADEPIENTAGVLPRSFELQLLFAEPGLPVVIRCVR